MNPSIPYLQPGDTIAIVSPAKAIEAQLIKGAKDLFEQHGFHVRLGNSCTKQHHYFSGTIDERRNDFQEMIDDDSVRAILCARGGYGSVQFIDQLNWTEFKKGPKWIIGFSDITVFHQHLSRMGYPSIHGTMPLNFKENTEGSLGGLIDCLLGSPMNITLAGNDHNVTGAATGRLIGGNLSILYSLVGTNSQGDYNNAVLFIEDLCEHLYHIDRMFHSLRKSGILEQINGLIVGGMSDMKDTEVPFGMTLEEIIVSHVKEFNIPVLFGFPAGHINNNLPLVLGSTVDLEVNENESRLSYR